MGISIRETGRRAVVDYADVSRALALKAATSRTVLRLARFFEVSEIEGVNREVRIQAALIELQANAERQATLLSNLAHLRAFDPPTQ